MNIKTLEIVQDHLTHSRNLSLQTKGKKQTKEQVLCSTQGSMLVSKYIYPTDNETAD